MRRWLASLLVWLALLAPAFAQTWFPQSSVPAPTVWLDFAGNYSTGCSGAFTNCLSVTNDGHGTATTLGGTVVGFSANTLRITDQGLLIEEARTEVDLWDRDLTNAVWTKTNVTAALDQTGADGTANSASSLLATAGNATCLQAITLGSSARFQTAYVKRLIGSGVVSMTMDNGSTWTAITLTTNWTRVSIPTQTLANPTVGFQIVTNGDKIAVDYVDNENGTFQTSVIATTTVAVFRANDVVTAIGPLLSAIQSAAVTLQLKTAPISGIAVGNPRIFGYQGAVTPAAINSNTQTTIYNGVTAPIATLGSGAFLTTNVTTVASHDSSGMSIVSNGGTETTNAAVMPAITTGYAGSQSGTSTFLNGPLRSIGAWASRLPAAVRSQLSQL